MSFRMGLSAILGAVLLLATAAACANGDDPTPPAANGAVAVGAMERATAAMEASTSMSASAAMSETARQTAGSASGSASGIWATGSASISVEPDLVLLTVGVESTAETVAEARSEAAVAMDAIVRSVKAHGLEDRDIQTRSFNIWPQYDYTEVTIGGSSTRKQVLVGYTVNNTAIIKIRDVEAVGTIIDDVAEAGGDATRIQGIRFSIEDTTPFMTQLREDAVKDAMEKAEHLASLAGVSLGDLVFISEVGAGGPVVQAVVQEAMMMRATSATPISEGELELSLNVQTVFSIE